MTKFANVFTKREQTLEHGTYSYFCYSDVCSSPSHKVVFHFHLSLSVMLFAAVFTFLWLIYFHSFIPSTPKALSAGRISAPFQELSVFEALSKFFSTCISIVILMARKGSLNHLILYSKSSILKHLIQKTSPTFLCFTSM